MDPTTISIVEKLKRISYFLYILVKEYLIFQSIML